MTFSCSMTDPGQPWVIMTAKAPGSLDFTWMKWIVEAVDLGDELRQGVQPRFAFAPVVSGQPVAGEGLGGRELHALR